jgi:hypothetical protein
MSNSIDFQVVLIVLVISVGIYLYFSYNSNTEKHTCSQNNGKLSQSEKQMLLQKLASMKQPKVVNINKYDDGYFQDPITRDDHAILDDPLRYPYARLPRNIIKMYMESGHGTSGHFGQMSNLYDDTEKIVGNLIVDGGYDIQLPAIPLFEKPSVINRDKYFYYIIDTRLTNNYRIKVPLKTIKINGKRRDNALDYGIEQIYDDDEIEILDYNFPEGTVFRAKLYPRQSGLYYNPMIPTTVPMVSQWS